VDLSFPKHSDIVLERIRFYHVVDLQKKSIRKVSVQHERNTLPTEQQVYGVV